ncbi:MAG: hypothetical protein CL565_01835 [Alphaproteobacteria bacterium]|nr:hypothetical protein [Alphaproteobacteria bacterium]|tara:strand:- start:1178 stop:1948 length:771 start_codon:yes stop_codon:yes gene_type:complete
MGVYDDTGYVTTPSYQSFASTLDVGGPSSAAEFVQPAKDLLNSDFTNANGLNEQAMSAKAGHEAALDGMQVRFAEIKGGIQAGPENTSKVDAKSIGADIGAGAIAAPLVHGAARVMDMALPGAGLAFQAGVAAYGAIELGSKVKSYLTQDSGSLYDDEDVDRAYGYEGMSYADNALSDNMISRPVPQSQPVVQENVDYWNGPDQKLAELAADHDPTMNALAKQEVATSEMVSDIRDLQEQQIDHGIARGPAAPQPV